MSYQLKFKDDGGVEVFIYKASGEYLTCSTTANNLPNVLPAAELDALRERCAEFLDVVGARPRQIKAVS